MQWGEKAAFLSTGRSGALRATVPHRCNPDRNAEFDSQRLGCSELWSERVSIMMRKIAVGLAAVTIATASSALTASALPGGGTLGVANSGDDGFTTVGFGRGGFGGGGFGRGGFGRGGFGRGGFCRGRLGFPCGFGRG